ncbi:DUF805 domain-containing protein [Novosphingobium bradum]|uniref:DUF805 domain-containing protein n=1 Tax=Novosphingobium bradum TaxID=1737444 RepID=A0ABV7IMK1_9SPHN
MEWMILPYRRYAEFTGRSRRREYWMFVLFQVLVSLAIGLVFGRPTYTTGGGMMAGAMMVQGTGGLIQNLFSLVSLVPGLAVAVRRLHDQDRSGWLLLLILIPFLGWFALLVFMCLEGTRGANRFGPDPKNPTDLETF